MLYDYNDVLKRLREERCRFNFSQSELAEMLCMSQGNYSKIELGNRRLSYQELQYLCRTDLDVHYIFTGENCRREQTGDLKGNSYLELSFLVCMLHLILNLYKGKKTEMKWDLTLHTDTPVSLIVENYYSNNVFRTLRNAWNYSQYKMAQKLGIDVKKLRNLETGKILPDSELLYRLYMQFRVPPSAVLKDKRTIMNEISVLLDKFSDEFRDTVVRIFFELQAL